VPQLVASENVYGSSVLSCCALVVSNCCMLGSTNRPPGGSATPQLASSSRSSAVGQLDQHQERSALRGLRSTPACETLDFVKLNQHVTVSGYECMTCEVTVS
jgi:hypothetical protein